MIALPEEKLQELFLQHRLKVHFCKNGRCIVWEWMSKTLNLKVKVFDGSARKFTQIVKGE